MSPDLHRASGRIKLADPHRGKEQSLTWLSGKRHSEPGCTSVRRKAQEAHRLKLERERNRTEGRER